MKSMLIAFGDVEQFLKEIAPATREKLKKIVCVPAKLMKIELAVVVDAGEPFVKSTYILEGDGPLAFQAYEEIQKLYAVITSKSITLAVAQQLSSVNSTQAAQQANTQQLLSMCRTWFHG